MTDTTKLQVLESMSHPRHLTLVRPVPPRSRRRAVTMVEVVLAFAVVCAFWGILASIAIQTVVH